MVSGPGRSPFPAARRSDHSITSQVSLAALASMVPSCKLFGRPDAVEAPLLCMPMIRSRLSAMVRPSNSPAFPLRRAAPIEPIACQSSGG